MKAPLTHLGACSHSHSIRKHACTSHAHAQPKVHDTHAHAPAREMEKYYHLGKVIGAGSFGTVREAVEIATGQRYAVKTVSKVPKRGPVTPR